MRQRRPGRHWHRRVTLSAVTGNFNLKFTGKFNLKLKARAHSTQARRWVSDPLPLIHDIQLGV